MSRQRHRDANLAARAEPGRTWTILTPARASTGPGELSVLVSGGCPSVPRWFHPHVKSCARQEEAQSKTGQNENSEQRGSPLAAVTTGSAASVRTGMFFSFFFNFFTIFFKNQGISQHQPLDWMATEGFLPYISL